VDFPKIFGSKQDITAFYYYIIYMCVVYIRERPTSEYVARSWTAGVEWTSGVVHAGAEAGSFFIRSGGTREGQGLRERERERERERAAVEWSGVEQTD